MRRAQKRLTLGGCETGGVDGIFRAKTESAVSASRRTRAWPQDGIVGPKTWDRIDALGD